MFKIDETVEYIKKSVPETSPAHYISGMCALNLTIDGDMADWHPMIFLYSRKDSPKKLITFGDGPEALNNTNHIYGDYGVIESGRDMEKWGYLPVFDKVYRANHHRAILDVLYYGIISYPMEYFTLPLYPPIFIQDATEDFLHTSEDKQIILDMSQQILSFIPEERQPLLREWVRLESRPHWTLR